MSAPIPEVRKYKVKGEWVDEPFITFGHAEMVLYSDYAALQAQLKAAQDLAADNFDVIQEMRVQKKMLEAQVQQLRETAFKTIRETAFKTINRFQDMVSWQTGESRNALVIEIRDAVNAALASAEEP